MNLLENLLNGLDAGLFLRKHREAYYQGKQPLAFLAPEARESIGNRFGRICSNIPRLAVNSIAERLRITGFRLDDDESTDGLWSAWQLNDLDQLAPLAHREALTLGTSYVICWADDSGRPQVSCESPNQVFAAVDPLTREVVAAVKRWQLGSVDSPCGTGAMLYLPDRIERWHSDASNAVSGFRLVETIPNPLGVCPVVQLSNVDRLSGEPASEIDDLAPLVDALNKLLADMMIASEFSGRPRRWATGVELPPDLEEAGNAVNPFPEGNKMMIAESSEAKFGQLDSADLSSYKTAVETVLSQIEAVSALPSHYLGVLSNQPASADALRAGEASLVARVEARQAVFGRAWERVANMIAAIAVGTDYRLFHSKIVWADPATRSVAQEADACVKLFQSGLLPATFVLRKLGYSDDEISQIDKIRRSESLEKAALNIGV